MSGNREKSNRHRQEQQRPSFLLHSCPVFISSPPSRISFSSSHGRTSISTKEKETRIHSSSKSTLFDRNQYLKDTPRVKTYSDVIKRCKSTESIPYLNGHGKRSYQTGIPSDNIKITINTKSKSYPFIEKEYISESLISSNHKDKTLYINRNTGQERNCEKPFNNSRKSSKYVSHVKQTNRKVEKTEVVQKRSNTKTSIKSTTSNVEPRISFPNSLLLFPFPTTPVEKCFSPKTPSPSPVTWNNCDKLDQTANDSKKTKGPRFEFGANFLRRFSLTQLTS